MKTRNEAGLTENFMNEILTRLRFHFY